MGPCTAAAAVSFDALSNTLLCQCQHEALSLIEFLHLNFFFDAFLTFLLTNSTVSSIHLQDVMVQSARPYGQRAVFKFAQYLNCKYSAGRHTPGTFTNQSQKNFEEPRLLILTDPRCDGGAGTGPCSTGSS